MNIFVTDPDPYKCAIALDDKRVGKMLIESVQMIATVMRIQGYPEEALPKKKDGTAYKAAFQHHPCTKWVGQYYVCLLWTRTYVYGLHCEHIHRRGYAHAAGLAMFRRADIIVQYPILPSAVFYDCTGLPPDERSIFDRYKQCLRNKWASDKRRPTWTNREPPEWR